MSSPFTLMRRHQKVMLAIFGVICMIVFVVGDAVGTATRFFSGTGSDPVVVKWNNGSLTAREFDALHLKHQITIRFLTDIAEQTKSKKGHPKVPGYQEASFRGPMVPGIAPIQSQEDLVARLLLAQKAQESGLVVNDESVKDFLTRLSDNLLSSSDWESILQNILVSGTRFHLTQQQVKDHLRLELAAQNMMQLQQRGLVSTSPVTAWDYYNKFHLRRKLEVLPLKVANYTKQVAADPSEAEIKELYEKHKDEFPYPSMPDPGFKQRKRVAFQYLMADFQDFLNEAKPSITDDAIQKEYDKAITRGEYKKLELPPGDDKEKPGESEPGVEKPESNPDQPEGKKPDEKESPDNEPDDKKPDDKRPDDKKPDDAKGDEKPADETPADETKPAEPAPAKPCTIADDPKELNAGAEQTPAPAKDGAQPPTTEKPEPPVADSKPVAEKPADKAKPVDDKPVDDKPADDKPADDKPDATAAGKAKPKPEVEFEPLEKVRDKVIEKLAKEPAEQARSKALEDARREVEKFSRKYKEWESEPEQKRAAKPELDVEALAKKYHLKAAHTPPVDALEIEEYPIGKTSSLSFAGGTIATYTFGQIAYSPEIQPYRPEMIRGDSDVEYLYWKTEEQPEYVPALDKIREQVVETWKRQEAYRLALKDAEAKAKEPQASESLKAAFGDEVRETPEFTWMSRGISGFGAPQLSSIDGVEFPGPSFMEKAFSLSLDTAGVAENHPKSVVYVIRVMSEDPPKALLRERFLTSGLSETRMLARQDSMEAARACYFDLSKELNVDWKRPPRVLRGE